MRIVSLAPEAAPVLHELGVWDRVVAAVVYSRDRRLQGKPRVGTFDRIDLEAVVELGPDLVLASTDVQAEAVRDLIRAGLPVLALNARTLADVARNLRLLGRVVGRSEAGEALARRFERTLDAWRRTPPPAEPRLRLYVEEWDDPLIAGMPWLQEMVRLAGGEPLFPELAGRYPARERIVDPAEVIRRNPQGIVLVHCGKRADPRRVARRPGWDRIEAVRRGWILVADPEPFLQPNHRLLEGIEILHRFLERIVREREEVS